MKRLTATVFIFVLAFALTAGDSRAHGYEPAGLPPVRPMPAGPPPAEFLSAGLPPVRPTPAGLPPEGKSVSAVLLLDASGSLEASAEEHRDMSKRILASLMGLTGGAGLTVSLVSFNDGVQAVISENMISHIDNLVYEGNTNLEEAFQVSREILDANPADEQVIFLLSDGAETTTEAASVLETAARANARVVPVCLTTADSDLRLLLDLAERTSGAFLTEADDPPAAAAEIIRTLSLNARMSVLNPLDAYLVKDGAVELEIILSGVPSAGTVLEVIDDDGAASKNIFTVSENEAPPNLISNVVFTFGFPGVYNLQAVLTDGHGIAVGSEKLSVSIIEPTPPPVTPAPSPAPASAPVTPAPSPAPASSPVTPAPTVLTGETEVSYLPFLNVPWVKRTMNPFSTFADNIASLKETGDTRITVEHPAGSDLLVTITGGTPANLQAGASVYLDEGRAVAYEAAPGGEEGVLIISALYPNGQVQRMELTVKIKPAYVPLIAMAAGLLLIAGGAAAAVILLKKKGGGACAVHMDVAGVALTADIKKKTTLANAVMLGLSNLLAENENDFAAYDSVNEIVTDPDVGETLNKITVSKGALTGEGAEKEADGKYHIKINDGQVMTAYF